MLTQFINPLFKALLIITIVAVALLSEAFSQNMPDNQIRIKILKEADGRKTEIDTTFTNSDEANAFMDKFNERDQTDTDSYNNHQNKNNSIKNFQFHWNDDSILAKDESFNFNFNFPDWSDDDRAQMDAKMKILSEELKKSIQSFNFKLDTSSAGNYYNYNFNFTMPDEKELQQLSEQLNQLKEDFDFNIPDMDIQFDQPLIPPIPAIPPFDYDMKDLSEEDKIKFEKQMKKAEEEYKKALDIISNKHEALKDEPPANKNAGKKIIIIEKSITETDKGNSSKNVKAKPQIKEGVSPNFKINKLNYFPNPNNGKFELSFNLAEKGDLNISITNESGKEIYHETLEAFAGDYYQSIDISHHGKGVYLLNISQGNQWLNKKIVVK